MHAAERVAGDHAVVQRLRGRLFRTAATLEEDDSFGAASEFAGDCQTCCARPNDAQVAIEARCGLCRCKVPDQSDGPLLTPATRKLFLPMQGGISETAASR